MKLGEPTQFDLLKKTKVAAHLRYTPLNMISHALSTEHDIKAFSDITPGVKNNSYQEVRKRGGFIAQPLNDVCFQVF